MGTLGDTACLLLLATSLQDEVLVPSNHSLLLGAGQAGHGRVADGAAAALPCPRTDARALGLPALKSSRRGSKGELGKEDLAWPLALAGAQEVSAPPGGECPAAPAPQALPPWAALVPGEQSNGRWNIHLQV